MFSKNDIIVESPPFGFDKGDMIDYDKNINDLFNLIAEIINDLNITSLKSVTINQTNIFTEEKGTVRFESINKAHVEFCRKVFAQFNNKTNSKLRNEALATIYHEMYHILDRENCLKKLFKNKAIQNNIKDNTNFFVIGLQYWSEFYAYYMTCDIYASCYALESFDEIYSNAKSGSANSFNFDKLYYYISELTAFVLKENCHINFKESEYWHYYVEGNKYYLNLKNELLNTLKGYPENISQQTFIILGKLYYEFGESLFAPRDRSGDKIMYK